MTRIKSLFAALVIAAIIAAVPAASAQTLHFVGAGSSAQWQSFAIGIYDSQLGVTGNDCNTAVFPCTGHWAAKGLVGGFPVGQLVDPRSKSGGVIPNEPGNIWVVFNESGPGVVTDIWTDLSVDSTVGVRAFFAVTSTATGAQININGGNSGTTPNAINHALFTGGAADTPLPAGVITAINAGGGAHVNAGITDIRPEDALFATNRALAAYVAATLSGLGYNNGPTPQIGNSIFSAQSTATATPVAFALSGSDPISGAAARSSQTLPVGAAPIVFFAHNSGAGTIPLNVKNDFDDKDTGDFPLAKMFDGTTFCNTLNAAFGGNGTAGGTPLTLFLREPLSGTMNTVEFTEFRTLGNVAGHDSQEKGVGGDTDDGAAAGNPYNHGCKTNVGSRQRAIGTGEVVKGVTNTTNSLGYAFFGYGNFSAISANPAFQYETLNGVDPINTVTPAAQPLPACANPCPLVAGTSFKNLRNGTYTSWSLYRVVADPTDAHFGDVTAVVQAGQDAINGSVPDYVPFHTTSGDDGLDVYRSHYTQSGVAANNGNLVTDTNGDFTHGGGAEAGGDMGGCIEVHDGTAAGVLNCQQQ